MKKNVPEFLGFLLVALLLISCEQKNATVFGRWKLNRKASTDLVTWRYRQLEMTIREAGRRIEIVNEWKSRRAGDWSDSVAFVPGGDTTRVAVSSPIWPENWYMGVLSIPGTERKISGFWDKPKKAFTTYTSQKVQIAQGETEIETERNFSLNRRGDQLTVIESRSTRPTDILMIFDKIEK